MTGAQRLLEVDASRVGASVLRRQDPRNESCASAHYGQRAAHERGLLGLRRRREDRIRPGFVPPLNGLYSCDIPASRSESVHEQHRGQGRGACRYAMPPAKSTRSQRTRQLPAGRSVSPHTSARPSTSVAPNVAQSASRRTTWSPAGLMPRWSVSRRTNGRLPSVDHHRLAGDESELEPQRDHRADDVLRHLVR